MKPHYHTIYLAPHLDDVTLSCGAQIYDLTRAGKDVLVVTVMAGDPPKTLSSYAQSLHERWELLAEAGAARRAEDLAACRILGADARHWPVPDCPYRTDPKTGEPLYVSDDDIFGDVHKAEMMLVQQVTDRLATLPTADRVVAPLTIGHHVDHLLVRAAAEMIYGARTLYYEDYPYAQETAKRERTLAAEPKPLTPTVVPVSEDARSAKIQAILAYRSQLSTFWTDNADLERQVFGYIDEVGGER
ncbi:MAG: PIG-L family deacetylase, partial [Caldilineaceae bacterium]|nr:PIG-L family deacetylase [Caldilineaceae bacterium]